MKKLLFSLPILVATVVAVSWPLSSQFQTHIIGSMRGEADNHFWMLWVGWQRILGESGPFTNWPKGWEVPLMDPVNLLWWVPFLKNPVAGYNLVLAGNLLVAGLGAWALCLVITGDLRAAVASGMLAVGAPVLLGLVDYGITECLPVGWLGLFAALSLKRPTGWQVGAWLALSLFLAGGWYHCLFGLPVVGLLILSAVQEEKKNRWRLVGWLVLCGLLAGATRIPALVEQLSAESLWAKPLSGVERPVLHRDWKTAPRFGTDLLSLWRPYEQAPPLSWSTYLGVGASILAVLGSFYSRKSRYILLCAVVLVVVGLGHWLRIEGAVVGSLRLPVGWLVEWVPALGRISHWYRALALASFFVAVAAGSGIALLLKPLSGGLFQWGLGLVLALGLASGCLYEGLKVGGTRWPLQSYRPDPPNLSALSSPGAIVEFPIEEVPAPYSARSTRPYNQWQVFHQRPIAENYEDSDEVLRVEGLSRVQAICSSHQSGPRRSTEGNPWPTLKSQGFSYIVAYPDLLKSPRPCLELLQAELGVPVLKEARVVVFSLQ